MGYAAHEKSGKTSTPMGAHQNEICLRNFSLFNNRKGGIPHSHLGFRRIVHASKPVRDGFHTLLCFFDRMQFEKF